MPHLCFPHCSARSKANNNEGWWRCAADWPVRIPISLRLSINLPINIAVSIWWIKFTLNMNMSRVPCSQGRIRKPGWARMGQHSKRKERTIANDFAILFFLLFCMSRTHHSRCRIITIKKTNVKIVRFKHSHLFWQIFTERMLCETESAFNKPYTIVAIHVLHRSD